MLWYEKDKKNIMLFINIYRLVYGLLLRLKINDGVKSYLK